MEYTYIVILHIIGTVIGAGGATYSDALFYKVIKDGKIDSDEYDILKMMSMLVWGGFILLVISGVSFLLHSDFPGATPKLYAKITIVNIIFLNAFILHRKILPLIHHHVRMHRKLTKKPFAANISITLASGAISFTSWYSALVLGGWRGLDATYLQIMSVYIILVLGAITIAQFIGRQFMKTL